MGTFINKGNAGFRQAVNGDYVDKTELIAYINKTLCTERSLSCIKRMRNVKVPSSAHEDTFIGLRRYLQEPAKVSSQKRQNFTAINVIVYETNSNRI